jgi:hypothetical protein
MRRFSGTGREQREQVIPACYHELKALAHLAFGVQLTLMANGSGRLTELTASELHEKRAQIREVQASINVSPACASSSPTMKGPAELLWRARTLVDRVLAEGVVDFERLQEHIRALASHALEHCATGRVHRARTTARAPQPVAQRSWREPLGRFVVVICGAHQPRYRDAASQYFGRLLHQPEGSGAEREDRLVYGEGLCDVDSALDLLARHIVDQRASNLLFGDRRRLQEDLLADAASTEVRKLFPKVRGCPNGAHRRAR